MVNEVYPQWWGAVGNSQVAATMTANTRAINAAIASLNPAQAGASGAFVSGRGGTVIIDDKFEVNGTIKLKPRVALKGTLSGRDFTHNNYNYPSYIRCNQVDGTDCVTATIDLSLLGNTSTYQTCQLQSTYNTYQLQLTRPWRVSITDLAILGLNLQDGTQGYGLIIGDPPSWTETLVTDGISNAFYNGWCGDIWLTLGSGYDAIIANNVIYGHGKSGIHCGQCAGARIQNNHIGANARNGIDTTIHMNGVEVTGNHLERNCTWPLNKYYNTLASSIDDSPTGEWTGTNATLAAESGAGLTVDGSALKMTLSAEDGFAYRDVTGLTANTDYLFNVFYLMSDDTHVHVAIDGNDTSTNLHTSIALTGLTNHLGVTGTTWTKYIAKFNTGSNTSIKLKLIGTTNGKISYWDGAEIYVLPSEMVTNGAFTSDTTGWRVGYTFTVSGVSTEPTAGAVYTNNGATFTVISTSITGTAPTKSGTVLAWASSGAPSVSGTLTKSSGTGDGSIAFSSVSYGATIAASGGKLSVTDSGSGGGYAYQDITTVVGATYYLSYKFYLSTATGRVTIGTTAAPTSIFNGPVITAEDTSNRIQFKATETTTRIGFHAVTAGAISQWDDIIVKRLDVCVGGIVGQLIEASSMTGNVIETSAYTEGYLHSYASYFYDPYGFTYSNYHEYGQPGALPLTFVYVYTGRSSSFVGNGFYTKRTDQTPSCQAFYLSSTNNVTAIGNLVYDVAASTVTSNMCTVAYMTGYVRSPVLLGNEVYRRDTGSGSWTSNRTTSEIYSGLSVAPGGIAHGDSLWVSGDFEQSGDVYQTGQASTVVSVGEFTKADDVAYINLGDTTFLGQVTIRAFPFFQSNNAMGYLEYECSFYHATGVATLTPADSICRTVKATGNIARWYFFGPAELDGTAIRIPIYHDYVTTDEYQTLSVEVIARSSVANHAKNLIAAVTATAPTPASHGLTRSYEEAEIGFKIWGREYGDDVTLADATLFLWADQGDDIEDRWRIDAEADTGNLSFTRDTTTKFTVKASSVDIPTGSTYDINGSPHTHIYTTSLTVTGVEGGEAALLLYADEGDDASDKWSIESNADNHLYFKNNGISAGDVSTSAWALPAAHIGGASDYMSVDGSGVASLVGSAKRILRMRPVMDVAKYIGGSSKPTYVTRGAVGGYSFPIYASDDEELFFRDIVPGRWDGSTSWTCGLFVYLASAEDVGDKFKFQLSHYGDDGVSGTTGSSVVDVEVETAVTTGHSAQYSNYHVVFTINASGAGYGSGWPINYRLRRIDAADPDITGEVVVKNWYCSYTVDKLFSAP